MKHAHSLKNVRVLRTKCTCEAIIVLTSIITKNKKQSTNPVSVQISFDLSGLASSTLFGAEPPSTVHVIVYLLPISTSLSLKVETVCAITMVTSTRKVALATIPCQKTASYLL